MSLLVGVGEEAVKHPCLRVPPTWFAVGSVFAVAGVNLARVVQSSYCRRDHLDHMTIHCRCPSK